ncbi:hypothetical protein [Georgenia sp. SYP-B2076]|uniref:hypothetical protein n=1 Tax=Georgenia sp. SYP-B2076 TaxID=2495881 RepID=UPI000F8DDAD9|nr:hypothetical protein [Georgenia sp. SYP-B2076]
MSPRARRAAERLQTPPRPAGQVLDARLHLLDRQVLDVDDVPVSTVDDIDIAGLEPGRRPGHEAGEVPYIAALLTGPVLGTRIFGGHPPSHRWLRMPWSDVSNVGVAVSLGVRGENLDLTWFERWVRDHVIARIPGGRHAPH